MDLKKACDRSDQKGMWMVLKVRGMNGKLINVIKAFYKDVNACFLGWKQTWVKASEYIGVCDKDV